MSQQAKPENPALEMDGPLHPDLVPWWEEFAAGEPRHGKDAIDALFGSGLAPLQRRREMERMIARAENPQTVMSIGTDKGSDIYAWCKLTPVRRFVACEARGVPYAEIFERMFPRVEFLWLPASSHDEATVKAVRNWLHGDRINVLFLDGDKSKFDVDFHCYLPLVARPGLVLFHDIMDEAPGSAFARCCSAGLIYSSFFDTSEVGPALAKPPGKRTSYEDWLATWHGRSCGVGVIDI